jgi:hypothetical protein
VRGPSEHVTTLPWREVVIRSGTRTEVRCLTAPLPTLPHILQARAGVTSPMEPGSTGSLEPGAVAVRKQVFSSVSYGTAVLPCRGYVCGAE